jgi:hypothetical protein
MTEAEARSLLAAWDGMGGIENWLAGQRWRQTVDGWEVEQLLQGWSFEVWPAGNRLRIIASAGSGQTAEWIISER